MGRIIGRLLVLAGVVMAAMWGRCGGDDSMEEPIEEDDEPREDGVAVSQVESRDAQMEVFAAEIRRVAESMERGAQEIEYARICAHFTGTQLNPILIVDQVDHEFALDASSMTGFGDVWCGDVPPRMLNGSVLEDVRVENMSGFRLKAIVFTYWFDDEIKRERVRTFAKEGGECYSMHRDGLIYVWYIHGIRGVGSAQTQSERLLQSWLPWRTPKFRLVSEAYGTPPSYSSHLMVTQ